jgi:general secretion pathway protein A
VRPVDRRESAVRAITALLAAWQVDPLGAAEPRTIDDLPRIGQRRGLDYLPLEGNVSMLRLLDLPAVLELHFPDADVRYVTLTALADGRARLTLDGAPVAVDSALLERHWFGQAYLLWRDFESLGNTLKPNASGAHVTRVQNLLERMGLYRGPKSGVYDDATVSAVTAFQRSRLLEADGRVGRLTRIVLYAAVGGYPRPTLVEASKGTS